MMEFWPTIAPLRTTAAPYDWPHQLYAQLIGLAAIVVLTWLLFQVLRGLIQAWEGTGLELGRAPKPKAVVSEEAFEEREEEEKTPEEVSDA
jgi:hypothetical protein